jgi:4-hydroxy-tetrahydrodipicolinate reductase
MGQAVLEAAATHADVRITAVLVRTGSPLLGKTWGGLAYSSELEQALKASDVLLDFSQPAVTAAALEACVAAGKPFVTGVTGFGTDFKTKLAAAGRKIPLLAAPNMSLGVALLTELARSAAAALGEEFDVEIIEAHHRRKQDAPSGTALALGEAVAQARGVALAERADAGRDGHTGPRRSGAIGFAVVRGGDIVGEHTAYFCGLGERLEITHRASSRETFARGAVRAAEWLRERDPGLYDMQDVLGLR